MKLHEYLALTGETNAAFAKRIGCTPGFITLLNGGKRQPSVNVAYTIWEATKGKVGLESWVGDKT